MWLKKLILPGNYHFLVFTFFLIQVSSFTAAQNGYIKTKEGKSILFRHLLLLDCLKSMNRNSNDPKAVSICECMIDKIDGEFTSRQYRKHTQKGIIDLAALIKEDSSIENAIKNCYTNSGNTTLLFAEGFEKKFMERCISSFSKRPAGKDSNAVKNFCQCELNMIRQEKLSDSALKELINPNSLLSYKLIYKCGFPSAEEGEHLNNWNKNMKQDIKGPDIDTVNILAMDGMSYIKLKIGHKVLVWLLDSGASSLLIDSSTERFLKEDNIINGSNYLGTAIYVMANGDLDTCQKYRINSVQIGKFYINNVILAVSKRAKRILAGKALLNKFSSWKMDNQNNILILTK